jgi:hypothetical protein
MTDFITEEMREAVARAMFQHEWQEGSDPIQFDDPDSEYQRTHEYWLAASRAALTAALPLIVEEIRGRLCDEVAMTDRAEQAFRGIFEDMAASLLPTTTKEG